MLAFVRAACVFLFFFCFCFFVVVTMQWLSAVNKGTHFHSQKKAMHIVLTKTINPQESCIIADVHNRICTHAGNAHAHSDSITNYYAPPLIGVDIKR